MKLKFDTSRGSRLKSQMIGFQSKNGNWWWNYNLKCWTQELNGNKYWYSTHRQCKSVRAFRRMLKTAPKGVEFKLWNKYVGRDVYGIGCLIN